MRTTRAMIVGLGTSTTLVLGVVAVFLVASTLVAFNAWPGGGLRDRIDDLFVNDSPGVAWDVPGPQGVATAAGVAAANVGTAAGGTAAGGAGTRAGAAAGAGGAGRLGAPESVGGGTVRVRGGTAAAPLPSGPVSSSGISTKSQPTSPTQTLGIAVANAGYGGGRAVHDVTQAVGGATGSGGAPIAAGGRDVGTAVANGGNDLGRTARGLGPSR